MVSKTNIPGYVKDEQTNAVTNNNDDKLVEYKNKIAKAKEFNAMKNEIEILKARVDHLDRMTDSLLKSIEGLQKITEIKQLLLLETNEVNFGR